MWHSGDCTAFVKRNTNTVGSSPTVGFLFARSLIATNDAVACPSTPLGMTVGAVYYSRSTPKQRAFSDSPHPIRVVAQFVAIML
jgi:hypothetical protein